jgi:subtilisin family serine protease
MNGMNRAIFLLLLLAAGSLSAIAQSRSTGRHWIFLRSRAPATLAQPSPDPASLGITDRALHRRAKVLPNDRLIDDSDLPPSDEALESIRQTGAVIHTVSRWLNAVSVEATSAQLAVINRLPAVAATGSVAVSRRPTPEPVSSPIPFFKATAPAGFDYGGSLAQLTTLRATELHDMGILGAGVLIGMLDDGFNNHATHEALASIRVVAEYDFIQRDSNTSRAPGEYASQGNHGTGTLSEIGAVAPGKMIGAAPGVSFVLAKTEIDSVEINAEEDNYVEALEWMERLGVDIASASLGYGIFDPGQTSYFWPQMDGHTSIVVKAVSVAARKGVLVFNAMGNEGYTYRDGMGILLHQDKTLTSPADADSMVAVGSTTSADVLAGSSGTGPTADGRIKPEVVTQGVGIYWVNGQTTNGYSSASGTSCATPLAAGAAALVLSAHPELTPMQIREALMATARPIIDNTSQTSFYPNNYYGSGSAHALNAALYHGPISSNEPAISIDGPMVTVKIHLRSNAPLVADSLRFYYRRTTDPTFSSVPLAPTGNPYEYVANILAISLDSGSVGYFTYADNAGRSRRNPFNAPDSVFSLAITTPSIPENVRLYANYPNPFNSGTSIIAEVPVFSAVELDIYNLLGQKVRTLFRGTTMLPQIVLRWDGRDDSGRPVSTGVYLYRLKTPTDLFVRKMLLVK